MKDKVLNLLYTDLCTRQPYGVKGTITIDIWDGDYDISSGLPIFRPMHVDVELLSINENMDVALKPITDDKDLESYVSQYISETILSIDDFTPYYRPVSDMTEEEMDKVFDILGIDKTGEDPSWIKINDATGIQFLLPDGVYADDLIKVYDYLNSIHIDYRGLIDLGVAKETTKIKFFEL